MFAEAGEAIVTCEAFPPPNGGKLSNDGVATCAERSQLLILPA